MSRKRRVEGEGFGSSFGDLLKAKGLVSADAQPSAPEAAPIEDEAPTTLADLSKVVLRMQRKGKGGKTVTRIEHIEALPDLEGLAKRIRKAMGAGARVEDGAIVVQGDLRARLEAWLLREGARQISS